MNKIILGLGLIALTTSQLTYSGSKGYEGGFIGGSVGHSNISNTINLAPGFDFDDNDTTFKATVGYRAIDFTLEGFYANLGEVTESGGGSTAVLDLDTIGVAVTGILSISEQIEVFGRLGFHEWDADASFSGGGGAEGDGTDFIYGAGLMYNVHDISVVLEFERYEVDSLDVDVASAGLLYRF